MQKLIEIIANQAWGEDVVASMPDNIFIPIEKFAELLVEEALKAVKATPTTCAYTTYDLGVVQCAILKSVETLQNHFKDQS
jgi:hypothetical protein